MRAFALALFAGLALAGAAAAADDCKTTLDGGWRCKESDGHVTERHPTPEGGRTTSTDPKRWGTSDGYGRGITPPDSMIRNSPILRQQAWGRVTDPWTPRKTPELTPGGWRR